MPRQRGDAPEPRSSPPRPPTALQVLVTIVYQRQIASQRTLEELTGVNLNSIGEAIAQTRKILQEHDVRLTPGTLRFRTPAALADFVDHTHELPDRVRVADLLATQALTGMTETRSTS